MTDTVPASEAQDGALKMLADVIHDTGNGEEYSRDRSALQFSDAFSDDLIMLDRMREALINDPLRPEAPVIVNASACRFLIVLTVTSIEEFLKAWRGHSEAIDDYFIEVGDNGERVKNGEKIRCLQEAVEYHLGKKVVDKSIFDDYLAIKYLRNVIVHSEWNEYYEEQVGKRGFPTDVRRLTLEHFHRIGTTLNRLQTLLFTTSLAAKEETMVDWFNTHSGYPAPSDGCAVITRKDLPRFYWNQIERIGIQARALLGDRGSSENTCAGALCAKVQIPLTDAVAASARELFDTALHYWHAYHDLIVKPAGLSESRLRQSRKVLENLAASSWPHSGVWAVLSGFGKPKNVPVEIKEALKRTAPSIPVDDLIEALFYGHRAYRLVRNSAVPNLYLGVFPVIVSSKQSESVRIGLELADIFALDQIWYACVECGTLPAQEGLFWHLDRTCRG